MSYDYDDYSNNYSDPNSQPPKKTNRLVFGMILSFISTLAVAYPTAVPWVISSVVFWVLMFITNMINFFVGASVLQLSWYIVLLAVTFFGLALPFFVAIIAYEEGRSVLARRRPDLARNFGEVKLFINNGTVMFVVEITVIVFAILGAVGVWPSGFGNAIVLFALSVLCPLLCYASSRLAAAAIK